MIKTMAIENPDWLDALYVQQILQNSENNESVEVSGITVKAATAVGDNYGSDMYRVGVEFSWVHSGQRIQDKKSLIVKTVPASVVQKKMIEAAGVFKTELLMISATLPRMGEILENVCLSPLAPRCFYVQYEKPTHVVMEDLAPRGFRMADRQAGLDLDHCLLAIRNLARFHAASIALKEKEPKAVVEYKKGIMHEDQATVLRAFFTLGVKALANETTKWSELSPRITEKLLKLSNAIFEKGCEAACYREDDFNVLNHGDFWTNNMLFRYDKQQRPIDHIFVDFQVSHYCSPAIDILYFLGTSPTDEIRLHHRERLLHEYHISLTSTMAKLKCNTEVLSFEKLKEALKKRAFYEVFAAMTILPGVLLEKCEVLDFAEIIKPDGQYENPGYRGKEYRKVMTRLLPWFDGMGLLDV